MENRVDEIVRSLRRVFPENITHKDIYFVCVGTDRSTGDSLGPFVGTLLKEKGYTNLIGTLEDPVHATNLEDKIRNIPKDKIIIGIDACLGKLTSVGRVDVSNKPLKPGAGVGKKLPQVGTHCITGIVNVSGFMEFFVLQNTRLHTVMEMSKDIVEALNEVFPRKKKRTTRKIEQNSLQRFDVLI